VEEIDFAQAFMFAYSPRRHTTALGLDEIVPPETQKSRLQELIELVNQTARFRNRGRLGESFEILVEGPSEKNPRRLAGRTRGNKLAVFDGPRELAGQLATIVAEKAFLWGFEGRLTRGSAGISSPRQAME
jgi:tRNA-2-methylthio-N6-dimethylallyladenosine synthase